MTQVRFNRPVNHDGKTYESIEIDEPTVGAIEAFEDAKAAGRSDTSATLAMLAVDTGMPIDAIRKIRTSDMAKISEALAPFVPEAKEGSGANGDA